METEKRGPSRTAVPTEIPESPITAVTSTSAGVEAVIEPESITKWRKNLNSEQNKYLDKLIEHITNGCGYEITGILEKVICTVNDIENRDIIIYYYI